MMRPHCDRCDKLCDEYPTWVEDNESPIDAQGRRMVGSGTNPTWHIEIDAGGDSRNRFQKMFCRTCRIAILEAHVQVLKSAKAEGGHLVGCSWDPANRRYECAEGCEIKRLNDRAQRGGIANGVL